MKNLDQFLQILNEPVQFADSTSDEDACVRMLGEFSETEAEEIACVSYAYWITNLKAKKQLPEDAQRKSALKEIRRHYVGEGRNYSRAIAAIREALEYRRRYRVDIIRSCFHDDLICEGEDAEIAREFRSLILEDLKRQPMVVRGEDDHGRVIIYKPPRESSGNTSDAGRAFILAQVYTAERAIAANDFSSKGKEERLTVVFNFRDYARKNSPPTSSVITMVKLLQRCYPERLGIFVVVDPPFWVRGAYNIASQFLSTATTEKLRLPSGDEAVAKEFSKIAGCNKNFESMLASGDICRVDLNHYTEQLLYYRFEQK